MRTVTLISKDDCSLCDVAKAVLLNTRKTFPFALEEKKITPTDSEFEKYRERIPVILIDGEFAFQYKVSERQLLEELGKNNPRGAQSP